jgi:hypothetical protein
MGLRVCHLPTGIVHGHDMIIEISTRLVRTQVSQVIFERVKIQAFDEPCRLRPKRKWQAANRHQICGTYNSRRAQQ